jgi:hypothetical protein
MVQGSARIFGIQAAAAVVAVFGALALAMSVATAQGDDDGNRFRTAIDAETVNGETLFVNRQHAGETSPVDQLIAIAPEDEDG